MSLQALQQRMLLFCHSGRRADMSLWHSGGSTDTFFFSLVEGINQLLWGFFEPLISEGNKSELSIYYGTANNPYFYLSS